MALKHFEFVVVGVPHSTNNDKNSTAKTNWMAAVRSTAQKRWTMGEYGTPLGSDKTAQVIITTYYTASAVRDVDNVIKPILDALQLSEKNRQDIRNLEKGRRPVKFDLPFHIFVNDGIIDMVVSRRINLNVYTQEKETSSALATALYSYPEFVHIEIKWIEED